MAPFPPLNDLLTAAAANLHPTRTLPHLLFQRQTSSTPGATVTVVTGDTTTDSDTTSNDPDDANDLSGGAIAGIVIGAIAGFLILVWIIRSCTNLGAPPNSEAEPGRPWYGSVRDEYPPRHRSRGRSRHSRRESYRHSRSHSGGHGGASSRSRSRRRVSVVREAVPVREVAPVVVRGDHARYYYGGGP
ncbi:hypothetical protein C8A03DRAFT_38190, partial [Achaetomium macrosporum]